MECTIPSSAVFDLLLHLFIKLISSVNVSFSSGIFTYFLVYNSLSKFYLPSEFLDILTMIIFEAWVS